MTTDLETKTVTYPLRRGTVRSNHMDHEWQAYLSCDVDEATHRISVPRGTNIFILCGARTWELRSEYDDAVEAI